MQCAFSSISCGMPLSGVAMVSSYRGLRLGSGGCIEDFSHFAHQIGWAEWLWQECHSFSDAFPQYDILGMTGHEQHLHAGSSDGSAFGELSSSEHRHHDIA